MRQYRLLAPLVLLLASSVLANDYCENELTESADFIQLLRVGTPALSEITLARRSADRVGRLRHWVKRIDFQDVIQFANALRQIPPQYRIEALHKSRGNIPTLSPLQRSAILNQLPVEHQERGRLKVQLSSDHSYSFSVFIGLLASGVSAAGFSRDHRFVLSPADRRKLDDAVLLARLAGNRSIDGLEISVQNDRFVARLVFPTQPRYHFQLSFNGSRDFPVAVPIAIGPAHGAEPEWVQAWLEKFWGKDEWVEPEPQSPPPAPTDFYKKWLAEVREADPRSSVQATADLLRTNFPNIAFPEILAILRDLAGRSKFQKEAAQELALAMLFHLYDIPYDGEFHQLTKAWSWGWIRRFAFEERWETTEGLLKLCHPNQQFPAVRKISLHAKLDVGEFERLVGATSVNPKKAWTWYHYAVRGAKAEFILERGPKMSHQELAAEIETITQSVPWLGGEIALMAALRLAGLPYDGPLQEETRHWEAQNIVQSQLLYWQTNQLLSLVQPAARLEAVAAIAMAHVPSRVTFDLLIRDLFDHPEQVRNWWNAERPAAVKASLDPERGLGRPRQARNLPQVR